MTCPEPWDRIQSGLSDLLRGSLETAVADDRIEVSAGILLKGLILLTGSRRGGCGEVQPGPDGAPIWKLHATASRAPGDTEIECQAKWPVAEDLERIFSRVIRGEQAVADEGSDHPQADSALGLPVRQGPLLTGVIVLTGRTGGYGADAATGLAPAAAAYAAIIEIGRLRNRWKQLAGKLETARSWARQLAELGDELCSSFGSLPEQAQGFGKHPYSERGAPDQAETTVPPDAAPEGLVKTPSEPTRAGKSSFNTWTPANASHPRSSAPRKGRVLVVEDFPPNRTLLCMQIETLGFPCDAASSGSEALARWRADHHDLILTDIHLPGMSGLELARAMRLEEKPEGGRVPIIAITAGAEPEKRDACREAGMDQVLIKPIELEILRETLGRWLEGPPPAPGLSILPESDLIDLFNTSTHQLLAECQPMLRQRNGRGIADAMHQLKSSAASLGARRVSALAVALEKAARDEQWSDAEALLAELEGALAEFEAASVPNVPRDLAPAVPPAPFSGADERISADDIRRAILGDEFEMHFQPEVCATSLAPITVVAIPRWRHGLHGEIPSEVFIPLAEEHALIGPLSEMLLSKALCGGALLNKVGFPIALSVNLSTFCLVQRRLADLVLASIRAAGMPTDKVILEFTELGPMIAVKALPEFTRLREKGIRFAIDDFGPGGSSPDRLSRMGFDRLKLSRETLRGASDASIPAGLATILARARHLGFAAVAKGVETEQDLELARTLGCASIQGPLIAEAMRIEMMMEWLQARRPAAKLKASLPRSRSR